MEKARRMERYDFAIKLKNWQMAISYFEVAKSDKQAAGSSRQQPLEQLVMYSMHVKNLNGNKSLGSSN